MSIATTNYVLNGFDVTVECDEVAKTVVIRLLDDSKMWMSAEINATNYTTCTEKGSTIGGFSNFVAILKSPTKISKVNEKGEYSIVWGEVDSIYFPLNIHMTLVSRPPEASIASLLPPVVEKDVNRTRPSSPNEDFHLVDKPAEEEKLPPCDTSIIVSSPNLIPVLRSIPITVTQGSCTDLSYDIKCDRPDPKTVVQPFLDTVPTNVPDDCAKVDEEHLAKHFLNERPYENGSTVDVIWNKLFGKKDEAKTVPNTICPILNSTIDEVPATTTTIPAPVPVVAVEQTYILEFGKHAKLFGFKDEQIGIYGANFDTCQTVLKPLLDENPLFDVNYLAKHYLNDKNVINLDVPVVTDEQKAVYKVICKLAFDEWKKTL
jgi:hypothetical protein